MVKLIREIVLDYAKVQLFESKVIRIEIFGNIIIGKNEAKAMNDSIGILSEGKESLILLVADEVTQFDREANEFSASAEGLKYTIADAFVVKGLAQKILANFYLKFNKPAKPSRIFNSEKAALEWLFSLVKIKV
ncbi:MAG: hypothetical protein ABIP51_15315 [Bacteroidia bacterium]